MTDVPRNSTTCKGEYAIVHILVLIFGISTWIGINAIYVQLPVIINASPEGWTLPAYLVLVIQAANVGPLFYSILKYFRYKINEPWWILCLLFSGTCAMGLLTFFHSETTAINEVEHSLALFILTFFNALVGCFSSVLFMPYLYNFSKNYLVTYFIGEGLSGVLPSIIALIQGAEDIPECTASKNDTTDTSDIGLKFSSSNYFLSIFCILFLSLIAFSVLEYSSFVKNIRSLSQSTNSVFNETQIKETNEKSVICTNDEDLTKQMQSYLFLLLALCCFFGNGFLPSIQSYSCLPYGNLAYTLTITFAQFANPFVCLLAFWFIVTDIKIISCLSIICLISGSYVIYLALMSPTPPLRDTIFGIFLVVISWTLLIGFISYLKLTIVSVFRNATFPKMLFSAGAAMQIGSASGAAVSFILINLTNYFQMHDSCATL